MSKTTSTPGTIIASALTLIFRMYEGAENKERTHTEPDVVLDDFIAILRAAKERLRECGHVKR